MTAFVCTTINPKSKFLLKNIDLMSEMGVKSFVVLDRRNTSDYPAPFINYRDCPMSDYERMSYWDSYSRKNIGFIRAAYENLSVFETDDDNLFTGCIDDLNFDWNCLRSCITPNQIANIFLDIYPNAEGSIWARGLPIEAKDNVTDRTITGKFKAGVVQYLVEGNPDVDAIYRLVQGSDINIRADDSALPMSLYNQFHPFNSQGTLWPFESLKLAYLPATCEFRMTDIWRGYIAQAILYKHNLCVSFEKAKLIQDRNQHDIALDFFGEWKGYMEVRNVLKTVFDLEKKSYSDMLMDAYEELVVKNIVEKKELHLLDAYLSEF